MSAKGSQLAAEIFWKKSLSFFDKFQMQPSKKITIFDPYSSINIEIPIFQRKQAGTRPAHWADARYCSIRCPRQNCVAKAFPFSCPVPNAWSFAAFSVDGAAALRALRYDIANLPETDALPGGETEQGAHTGVLEKIYKI